MAHQIDGQDQTPAVGKRDDQALQRCKRRAVGDEEVHESENGRSKDDGVVLGILVQGINQSVLRLAVPSIGIFGENGEDEPGGASSQSIYGRRERQMQRTT